MNPYTSSYVGKIRKPPGGDTSDIFNLHPQKSYTSVVESSIPAPISKTAGISVSGGDTQNGFDGVDESGSSKNLDATIQDSSKKEDNCEPKKESPDDRPSENISPESNLCEKMNVVSVEGKPLENMKEENLKAHPYIHDHYNPITGQSMDIDCRPKLVDCSNKVITADGSSTVQDTFLKESADYGLTRPSIRIRYPPGGASSNIF